MRLIKCKDCGKEFYASRYAYKCADCVKKSRASTLAPRVCRECGNTFEGGPRAWYCPICREARKLEQARERRKRKSRKLGSEAICEYCGKTYIVTGQVQKYCLDCKDKAVREKVNAHKMEYWKENREECERKKKERTKDRKVCTICGKVFTSDSPRVTCSDECAKTLKKFWKRTGDYRRGGKKPADPRHKIGEKYEDIGKKD